MNPLDYHFCQIHKFFQKIEMSKKNSYFVSFTLGAVHKWRHAKRGVYQGFCDNSTKALVLKRVTMMGEGIKNHQKLRYVFYGRPPSTIWKFDDALWISR
jgi:hypothetical protein